jgi:hypothetical protein
MKEREKEMETHGGEIFCIAKGNVTQLIRKKHK